MGVDELAGVVEVTVDCDAPALACKRSASRTRDNWESALHNR